MLQLLLCSDVHTYTDNIRLAIEKTDRVDAVLIAGDLEAEQDSLDAAVGGIPCYAVCGNNDYYLHTDYPQELLIDIADPSATASHAPSVSGITELSYDTLPDTGQTRPLSFLEKVQSILAGSFSATFSGTAKRPPGTAHRILMTHGKEYHVPETALLARRARLWDADLVLYGHTHQFADTGMQGGRIRLINPGCLMGEPGDSIRVYGRYEICSFAMLCIGRDGEISLQHMYIS